MNDSGTECGDGHGRERVKNRAHQRNTEDKKHDRKGKEKKDWRAQKQITWTSITWWAA